MKKRILSLTLSLLLLLTLLPMSALAGFTDHDDIDEDYLVSVDTMAALGVIDGMPDGSYDPMGLYTREQAAKIIAYIVLGSDAAGRLTASTSIFQDVAPDRWSAPFIGYCANLGIIAGKGDGNFYPTDKLTGYQYAKMLLCAIGYDAAAEKFAGSADWSQNVLVKAQKVGISDGLKVSDYALAITRQEAAQMSCNAIKASMVTYTAPGDASTCITTGATLMNRLESQLGTLQIEGVVTANEFAGLNGSPAKKGQTTLYNEDGLFPGRAAGAPNNPTTLTLDVSTSEEHLGLRMTGFVKYNANSNSYTSVGGLMGHKDNTVLEVNETASRLTNLLKEAKLNENGAEYYLNYTKMTHSDLLTAINPPETQDNPATTGVDERNHAIRGIPIRIVDNDGDGQTDYIFHNPATLTKIDTVNTTNQLIRFEGATPALNMAEGLHPESDEVADGDMFFYRSINGRYLLYQAETIGDTTVSAVYSVTGTDPYAVIDGTNYPFYNSPLASDLPAAYLPMNQANANAILKDTANTYDFFIDPKTGDAAAAKKVPVYVDPGPSTTYALVVSCATIDEDDTEILTALGYSEEEAEASIGKNLLIFVPVGGTLQVSVVDLEMEDDGFPIIEYTPNTNPLQIQNTLTGTNTFYDSTGTDADGNALPELSTPLNLFIFTVLEDDTSSGIENMSFERRVLSATEYKAVLNSYENNTDEDYMEYYANPKTDEYDTVVVMLGSFS